MEFKMKSYIVYNLILLIFASMILCPSINAQTSHMEPSYIYKYLCPGDCFDEVKTVYLDAPPARGDILFCVDLTGSMGGILTAVKTQAISIMNGVRAITPNTKFGVVSHIDTPNFYSYCGDSSAYGSGTDYSYHLNLPLTSSIAAVSAAINSLTLGFGNDTPESYLRCLYESYADTAVGWRLNSKKIWLGFGDNIP